MTFTPVRKRARPYNRAMSARTKTTKTAPAYRCTECGWTTAKWVGRCGECQTWGTVEEAAGGTRARTRAASSVQKPAQPIAEVDSRVAAYMSTGNPEFDRVLGGGLVPGAVILMAGWTLPPPSRAAPPESRGRGVRRTVRIPPHRTPSRRARSCTLPARNPPRRSSSAPTASVPSRKPST